MMLHDITSYLNAPMPLPVAITIIVLSILDGTLIGLVFTQWFFKKFIHKQ
jgi:uncharacterized protein YneF (UPF0154 family)